MKTALFIAVLLLSSMAEASCNLSSARVSAGLIKVGDPEQRVIESAPDRTVQIQTQEGEAAGYRHDFHQREVTVQVYVQAGRVVRVCRIRS